MGTFILHDDLTPEYGAAYDALSYSKTSRNISASVPSAKSC
jgi:hypothetical protein